MNTKTRLFVSVAFAFLSFGLCLQRVSAAQTTGGVNWLDPLGYQKPTFLPITIPDETTVSNKWWVNLSGGSGTACTESSPCGSMDSVLGKAGTTGGPAYIYIKGTGGMSWYQDNIYGSPGNEVVIKPWPAGSSGCPSGCSATLTGNSNANSLSGYHDVIWDGGPNLGITFLADTNDGNTFAMTVNGYNLTYYRVQGKCGANQSAGTFSFGNAGINNNIKVVNSEFSGCNQGSGSYQSSALYASPGGTNGNYGFNGLYVWNNIIREEAGEAVEINPRATSDYFEFVGNAVHNVGKKSIGTSYGCRPGVVMSIQSGGGTNHSLISNNLIWDTCSGCFWDRGSGSTPTQFVNNTCYNYNQGNNSDPWPMGIAGYSNSGSAIVKNNIIYDPDGTAPFDGGSYQKGNNICGSSFTSSCGTGYKTWSSGTLSSTVESNANFLGITPASEAYNAGQALSNVTFDYARTARPQSSVYDIGAYEYGTPTPDTQPPTFPTNLAASATSQSSITVSWNPATDDIGVTGYQVERCTGLSCTTFANVGNPTASPFVDSGLTASTGYSYHVRALDAAGNMSGWSNVVGATTQAPDTTFPSAPTNLQATAASSSTINLTWTASTDNVGVTGYKVERCSGASCTTFTQVATSTTNSYQDAGLSASTTYRYQVRATDAANNNSSYSSIAQAITQTPPPVSANMMAAYNFNENTGTTINDLSGHTNTGTASNTTWTTGKNGSALSFNGSSSSVSVPDNNTLDITGSFTLSAWIYSSNLSGYRDVILKGNNANNYYLETNGTNISFGFYQSGVWHEHNSTSANLQTNTWTHVAGVFDTDANTVTLYKNGVQIYQASETGTPPANTLPLTIGSGFSGENYGGSIDDVRIYNTALTQTDIQTDMNTPLTQPTSTASCNTVTTTNFSQSAYNSYGAPFDAFQTSTNLLDAKCNTADTHTINLTTGVTGDTTRIVYTKGYYYDPVTAGWTQYSGTCNGALNGEWCQGSVSATITSPNLSTASASNPAYLVGMTCSVQGGGWKCGCRDTSCANFYWQVQGAGM